MSTGSLSDVEDLQEVEMLECDGLKMDTNKEFGASTESNEEGSNGENGSPQKGRGASGKRKKAPPKKSPLNGVSQEGKQVQRNAANARERARMRVLSKAFSRLKTTLPWVPPDTKLSKLDTLRLASSYIAHLRQILANDKYENGYIHPVNLVSHGPPGPGTLRACAWREAGEELGWGSGVMFVSDARARRGKARASAGLRRSAGSPPLAPGRDPQIRSKSPGQGVAAPVARLRRGSPARPRRPGAAGAAPAAPHRSGGTGAVGY
ncbi:PREDICTED: transcription factor 21 [Nipponia nippon]|uniref:transcription factor 21 n=1 Tax=Nipponia nippon TaxID=128390 RepID=UPI0005114220|nr:PREDICTED: transcription factor 21 [Nipponia nippon]